MKRAIAAGSAALSLVLGYSLCTSAQGALSVDELVRRLGSDSFTERESATKALASRDDSRPALEKALMSPDTEVSRRARRILDDIDRAKRDRLFKVLQNYAGRQEVDRLVDVLTCQLDQPAESRSWEVMLDLAAKLIAVEAKKFGRVPVPKEGALDRIGMSKQQGLLALGLGRAIGVPRLTAQALGKGPPGSLLIRAGEIDVVQLLINVSAVCAGDARFNELGQAVVFANGDVGTDGSIAQSIVVSDGDVTAQGISHSLVIARGAVKAVVVGNSTILCGGNADVRGTMVGSAVISASELRSPPEDKVQNCTLKAKEAGFAALASFFDTAEVGITLREAKGGVEVRWAVAGKSLTDAGLRQGDLITAVHGDAAKSPESVRRLIRKRLAVNEPFAIQVHRAELMIDIKVPRQN